MKHTEQPSQTKASTLPYSLLLYQHYFHLPGSTMSRARAAPEHFPRAHPAVNSATWDITFQTSCTLWSFAGLTNISQTSRKVSPSLTSSPSKTIYQATLCQWKGALVALWSLLCSVCSHAFGKASSIGLCCDCTRKVSAAMETCRLTFFAHWKLQLWRPSCVYISSEIPGRYWCSHQPIPTDTQLRNNTAASLASLICQVWRQKSE